MAYNDDETRRIIEKYERKLGNQINLSNTRTNSGIGGVDMSREYSQFKEEMIPQISRYERLCKSLGSIITVKVSSKDEGKIQRSLDIAHLEITPGESFGLAIMALLIVMILGIISATIIYLLTNEISLSFIFLSFLTAIFLFYYYYSTPERLANKWRLKASSQMVPCMLYVVAYMKHTSNLERAIQFVSQNLPAPLSLDFKKVFYDVETGRYSSIKESLDHYLETWRDYSIEFVESFHLVESSLYEPDESERLRILERSLQVILDGVYEKMLKFSHEVRSPLTNLYMLGIVLPTLGLALLPLASALLGGIVKWYHIVLLFNIIIPLGVFYLSSQIMLKRPGGYGETDTLEKNPYYPEYKSTSHYWKALIIVLPLIILGLSPLFITQIIGQDPKMTDLGLSIFGPVKVFDYQNLCHYIVGFVDSMSKLVVQNHYSQCVPYPRGLLFHHHYNQ